jgi:hypothetical protein
MSSAAWSEQATARTGNSLRNLRNDSICGVGTVDVEPCIEPERAASDYDLKSATRLTQW